MMLALLVFVATTQVAEGAKVYIGKSRPVHVEVYNTLFSFRVGDPIFDGDVTPPVTIEVDTEWWSTDISVKQRFLADNRVATHNVAAFVQKEPGVYTMAELGPWLQENADFDTLFLPDVNGIGMDANLYVAVDIAEWLHMGGVPLPWETVLDAPPVIDGEHPDLPGYHIGFTPILYDPNQGWKNLDPYNGPVTVVGEIGLRAPGAGLDFDMDYSHCLVDNEPGWLGDFNPEYPYQHIWNLVIHDWDDVEYVSDIDIEGPIITPGYIEVVAPQDWHSEGVFVGRYGYEANPGAEVSAGGGSWGIELRVNGKVPTVVPGTVTLTWKDVPVSHTMDIDVWIVGAEPPAEPEFEFTFDHMGYVEYGHADWVGGPTPEYPYQHSWELNITQWDPVVLEVTDVEIEWPIITPGYVQVIPPENWSMVGMTIGRYGYENNTGDPITNEGKYTGFRVKAKTPQVEPGHVYLTQNGEKVTYTVETMVVSEADVPSPYLMLDTSDDWTKALGEEKVRPMTPDHWDNYMDQWNQYYDEVNEPYPDTNFMPPNPPLLVYDGNAHPNYPDINDAGLIMAWDAIDPCADGDFASAWQVKYGPDPDLTNCLITVAVTAPQFGFAPPFSTITQVSLGLQDSPTAAYPLGAIRSWFWNCGPGQPIPWNVPTTITIDTSKVGVGAATPTATGYMNNPGFSLKTVQWVIVDENANWVGGTTSAPNPGGFTFMWNYWHWLMVTPKTTVSKGYYSKWSQPPVVIDDDDDRPIIIGWDERSDYHDPNIVADDWLCEDDRPVTDIHWWGSYIGWTKPYPPPIVPIGFHLGIWTDDPCSAPGDFSHPNDLIWENYCYKWVWNFAGYDRDPRLYPNDPDGTGEPNKPGFDEPMDTCFQFNQLLSQDEWFYQEPNDPCDDDPNATVYWLSVAPIYNPGDYGDPNFYPWGWKTRRPEWNDDAVRISSVMDTFGLTYWPPIIGSRWASGTPIKWPDTPTEAYSWDVSFELTTNEPGPPNPDINNDGIVNFVDFGFMANRWLMAGP